jgi:hypothetical protein
MLGEFTRFPAPVGSLRGFGIKKPDRIGLGKGGVLSQLAPEIFGCGLDIRELDRFDILEPGPIISGFGFNCDVDTVLIVDEAHHIRRSNRIFAFSHI